MKIILGIAAATLLCGAFGAATAQQPTADDFIAQADYCNFTGLCSNGGGQTTTTTRFSYDPCYLAQNALRPCTSADIKALQPHGVDPNLIGTWELPLKGGLWVLTVKSNGTYAFRSDAHDGAPSHSGTFAASNGSWAMKATVGYPGYTGSGNYLYQAPDVFIATVAQGAVSWLRPELAKAALGCKVAHQKSVNPSTLDANLIGTWTLPVKTGNWVWEIAADGSYKFHSEALDGAPSHSGVFTASNWQWTLAATAGIPGYTDNGQYLYQAPNILMAKGLHGGVAWIRRCNG